MSDIVLEAGCVELRLYELGMEVCIAPLTM